MTTDGGTGRRVVAWLVVGLVALLAVAIGFARPYDRAPVDDYIAKAAAEGKPVSVRALIGPDPPAEENGAPALEEASKWMDRHAGDQETWTLPGPWNANSGDRWLDELTDAQRRDLEAFFADAKPFFDGVAAAVAKPRLRGPLPVEGAAGELTDIQTRIRIGRLLSVRALTAARAEDRLDATSLLAELAVRAEPRAVIDAMLSVAEMTQATDAIRRSVERGEIDAAAWRARLDAPLSVAWLPRFAEQVRLDRAQLLELLRTGDLDRLGSFDPAEPWTTLVRRRISARLDAVIRMRSAPIGSPADYAAALAASAPLESVASDSYAALAAEVARIETETPQTGRAIVMRSIAQRAERLARTDAAARLARIALAAAQYHALTGDWPGSLRELEPMLPGAALLDPFTDAPFEYARRGNGVRIASAGRLASAPALSDEELRERGLVWELSR